MSVNYFSIHTESFSVHLRMLSVVVIGTGNVARQLCQAWTKHPKVKVLQVIGRKESQQPRFEGIPISNFGAINPDADYYIIAVSDKAISSVYQQIKHHNKLIVHTSGSIAMDALISHSRRGVFYPLQTFSKGREVDLSTTPFLLECIEDDDREKLEQLAMTLSDNIHWIDSATRRHIHLSAVYLNNFVNHLIYLSQKQCNEMDLDPGILNPLLQETVAKAIDFGPYEAQTGPARRGDDEVTRQHLQMLEDPLQREVYSIISQSIQSTYENELQKFTQ